MPSPTSISLNIRGLDAVGPWENFQATIEHLVHRCAQEFDLSLLDGITIGFDYAEALRSVDLGYLSDSPLSYTQESGLIGVAKMVRVRREEKVKAHIVFNGNVLSGLNSLNDEQFMPTVNLFVHEMAHVQIMGWFVAHSPNILLNPRVGNWIVLMFQETADVLWDEYAACRLSARYGFEEILVARVESVESAVDGAFSRAREGVQRYRDHRNEASALVDVTKSMSFPLKLLSYLLGHLDGCESELDPLELCPKFKGSELAEFLPGLRSALRRAWETHPTWTGMDGYNEIADVIVAAVARAGVELKQGNDPLEPLLIEVR